VGILAVVVGEFYRPPQGEGEGKGSRSRRLVAILALEC
jgi:hypothetical protein